MNLEQFNKLNITKGDCLQIMTSGRKAVLQDGLKSIVDRTGMYWGRFEELGHDAGVEIDYIYLTYMIDPGKNSSIHVISLDKIVLINKLEVK